MRLYPLFLLVLLPSAYAAIVSDVSFTGGNVLNGKTVLPGDFQATMQFSVDPQYGELFFQPKTFTSTQGSLKQFVLPRDCPNYVCTILVDLSVPAGSAQHTVQFSVAARKPSDTAYTSADMNYIFEIDAIKPKFLSIGTPTCTPSSTQQCGLRDGANIITARFQESGSGMKTPAVALQTPQGPLVASLCGVDSCNFTYTLQPGTPDGTVVMSLLRAADRSGNSADPSSVLSTFTIDNTPPVIGTITTNNPTAVASRSFQLQFSITEHSTITASATFGVEGANVEAPAEQRASCSRADNDEPFRCTLNVAPKKGSYTLTAHITVTDSAGLTATADYPVTVAVTSEQDQEFWVASTSFSPSVLDRTTSQFFGKQVFAPLTLDNAVGGDVIPVLTATKKCGIVQQGENGEQLLALSAQTLGDQTTNPIILLSFQRGMNLNELGPSVTIRCEVEVTSYDRGAGVFYDHPQTVTVENVLAFSDSPLVQDKAQELTTETRAKVQKSIQQIQTYQQYYRLGTALCTATRTLGAGAAAATGAQAVVSAMPPPADGASGGLRLTQEGMNKAAAELQNSPFGQKLCSMITCEGGQGLLNLNSAYGPFGDAVTVVSGNSRDAPQGTVLDDVAAYTTGNPDAASAFYDPYKSFVVAWATMCLPAMLYHEETRQQIQCQYLDCLENQVSAGLPISACGAQRSYATCKFIWRGVFYASPLAVAQKLRDNALYFINNPVAAAGFGLTLACKPIRQDTVNAFCNIPKIARALGEINRFVDAIRVAQQAFQQPADTGCLARAVRRPQSTDTNILSDGVDCYGGICCTDGYCRAGSSEYYRQYQLASRGAPPQEDWTRERDIRLLTNYGAEYVLERDVPSRAKEKLDRHYYALYGLSSDQVDDLINDDDIETAARQERAGADALRRSQSLAQNTQAFRNNYGSQLSSPNGLTPEQLAEIKANLQRDIATKVSELYDLREDIASVNPDTDLGRTNGFFLDRMEGLTTISQELEGDVTPERLRELIGKSSEEMTRAATALQTAADKQSKIATDKLQDEAKQKAEAAFQQRLATDTGFRFMTAVSTGLELGRTAEFFGSVFGFDPTWGIDPRDVPNPEELFIKAICEGRNLGREPNIVGLTSNGRVGMYLIGTRTDTTVSADVITSLDIQAEVDALGAPADETTGRYEYLISGQSLPQQNALYTLTLQGSSGTYALKENEPISPGKPLYFGGRSMLIYRSDDLYEEVCVSFDTDIRDLFPTSRYDGRSVCLPLKEVTEG